MASGNVTRRGTHSWRLKFEDAPDATGNRRTRYETVHGTKRQAQERLTQLLAARDGGTAFAPSASLISDYLRAWLDADRNLSPKTRERYRQLAEQQIIPHLGAVPLQKLRPAAVAEWHTTLLASGGVNGRPLSARTVGHAHRVLHRGLERALQLELVGRNVAHAIRPPRVEATEIEILSPEQVVEVLDKLIGHPLHPIVAMAIGTGMRRGEICALPWHALDLDGAVVRVERSLEETQDGLRFKAPKSRHGRRSLSIPGNVIEILRAHRQAQLELRLQLGLGRLGADDLVFAKWDGQPYRPDNLSRDWIRTAKARGLPRVMFHALRHSHVSALIAAGLDPVSISRRIGHGSAAVTLAVYSHLFRQTDQAAADAIDAVMRPRGGA
jgi:integrase